MKNIVTKLSALATVLIATVACVDDQTKIAKEYYNDFIASNEIMAMADGVVVKSFEKSTDQVIYNDERSLFMLSDVNYTSQYTITINGEIALNNKVTVNYKSNIEGKLQSGGSASMEVVKADTDDSRYWLWSKESNIGFIVDFDF